MQADVNEPDVAAETEIPSRRIDQLVTVGTVAEALEHWDRFVPFRPVEMSRAADRALVVNASYPEPHLQAVHQAVAEVGPLGLYCVRDVIVSGHFYPTQGGVFLDDGSEPSNIGRSFARMERLDLQTLIHRQEQIVLDRPALIIGGPGYPIWGHWLLDFLPRLAIAREVLGGGLDAFVIPMPGDIPDWIPQMMQFFCGVPDGQIVRYDRQHQSVLCPQACLPTVAHNNYFLHSFLREFYGRFASAVPPDMPRRFCVSRKSFGQTRHSVVRVFREEAYFEEVAERFGYVPVYPETLSLQAQVDLFAHATSIAGQYGSGIHSALFSPPGTLVGQFCMPNAIQSRIAGLCGHRMGYLIPDMDENDAAGVRILSVNHAAIDRFFTELASFEQRTGPVC